MPRIYARSRLYEFGVLASFARSVRQVMDPRFFLPCFHGPCASRLSHKRKEKNSVHNLPYGPRTRLIRGIYCTLKTRGSNECCKKTLHISFALTVKRHRKIGTAYWKLRVREGGQGSCQWTLRKNSQDLVAFY